MTQLSKLAILGIGTESPRNTYTAPTAFIPFTKCDYEDIYAPIKDESYRGNDSSLQGLYQGVGEADFSIDLMAYPDITGYFLRGIIGPDTVTAGTSTTLSALTTIGATSISVAASIAMDTYVKIGSGAAVEYAKVTAVSGSGPYTLTVQGGRGAGLLNAHASGDPVVGTSLHTFQQSIDPNDRATFSLTIFDTLTTTGYVGAALSDLDIKIDPKNAVTLSSKFKSYQGVSESAMTPAFSSYPPALGWQWNLANAGASSSRGTSMDLKIKRKIDVIHSSDGDQFPREIFQGALDCEGTLKAIYENQTDFNLFLQNAQLPTTATLQQPIAAGGSCLTLTMSKSAYHKGKRDWKDYVEASFSLSGVYNATDGGIISATLTNFQSAAY